ncbi:MAG TPA: BatD family protein [Chthoniobacterales bacterium]|nr:BatD family protein [Chthoniobacterales bacterium]
MAGALGFFVVARAFADSPSATAVLSNSEAAVGETVRLQIRVTGTRSADAPEKIAVDGLQIYRTGTSQHFEMNNFNVTSSVIYDYTILPMKAGTFKIPPQTIRLGSSAVHTPELTLNVADSPGRSSSSRSNREARPESANQLVFAELVVPKKVAFVGEMVPAEIRLGFDPRAHPELADGPEIAGQGFTTQKLQQAQQNLETINGRTYDVITFKTAIAATRAGRFEIGPVKAKARVSVPRRQVTQRSRSRPFDLFNLDDPFSDPFFADPFGRLAERREVEMESEPATFEVKPLPPNAPPNFSGAVGNFAMTTEAKPKRVQVGDPITVTSTVSGRGNFDRVNAPALEDDHGWHKYPSSSKFKQDDDVGISGAKTFETVISPNEKKQALPPLVFSYFDPVKENYVTVRSDAMPITVEGGAATGPAVVASQPGSAATMVASAKPSPKPQDILYQLTQRPNVAQSFTPLYAQPLFWTAQFVPLFALLGLIGWKATQARRENREAQRITALQHEVAELMRKLRRDDSSPQEYFSQASRAVRVKTALARNIDPNAVDAETAATVFDLDENERTQLHRLFERSDELRYSGAHNGAETISPESRREVLDLLENLRT